MAVDQRVLLHHPVAQPEKTRKFQARLTGPFEIKKVLEHIVIHPTLKAPVHADRLTVYLNPSPNTGDIFKHTGPSDVINIEACKTLHQPMQQNAQGIMPPQNPVDIICDGTQFCDLRIS